MLDDLVLETLFICHGSRGDDQRSSLARCPVLDEAKHAAVHDLVSSRCSGRARGMGGISAALWAATEDLLLRHSPGDRRVDFVENPAQGGVLQRFAELLLHAAQFELVHVSLIVRSLRLWQPVGPRLPSGAMFEEARSIELKPECLQRQGGLPERRLRLRIGPPRRQQVPRCVRVRGRSTGYLR
ncbi:hypothetical protein GCM10022245_66490 [Streptomyces mayteni]